MKSENVSKIRQVPAEQFKRECEKEENVIWLLYEDGAIYLHGYLTYAGSAYDYPRYEECRKEVTDIPLKELWDDMDVSVYIYDNGTEERKDVESMTHSPVLIDGLWYYRPMEFIKADDVTVYADRDVTPEEIFETLDLYSRDTHGDRNEIVVCFKEETDGR